MISDIRLLREHWANKRNLRYLVIDYCVVTDNILVFSYSSDMKKSKKEENAIFFFGKFITRCETSLLQSPFLIEFVLQDIPTELYRNVKSVCISCQQCQY
jgi:hypothetical protein